MTVKELIEWLKSEDMNAKVEVVGVSNGGYEWVPFTYRQAEGLYHDYDPMCLKLGYILKDVVKLK